LPATGSGVGVGRGVGRAVGRGVETIGGCAVAVAPGVGLGSPAIGPSVGTDEAGGSADGGTDGSRVGSVDGSTVGGDAVGSIELPADDVGLGSVLGAGLTGAVDGLGEAPVTAMSRSGDGATTPAVSATVARMRFRSPMATTRRAR
jgi:hypothetical protein